MKAIENDEIRINCLVLGKSGVGKSSLLNYLFDRKVAETGAGRPVTQRKEGSTVGIYEFDPIDKGEYKLCIFESWGIEADKSKDWLDLIHQKVDETDRELKINSWFHCVVYCISAKGARLEEFEVEDILKTLQEKGIGLVFALTKSDMATADEIEGLKDEIRKNFGSDSLISEICSEKKRLRSGQITEAYGKETLGFYLYESARLNLLKKHSSSLLINFKDMLETWIDSVLLGFHNHGLLDSASSRLRGSAKFSKLELRSVLQEFQDVHDASFEKMQRLYAAMFSLMIPGSDRVELSRLDTGGVEKMHGLEDGLGRFWVRLLFPGVDFLPGSFKKAEKVLEKRVRGIATDIQKTVETKIEFKVAGMEKRLKDQLTAVGLQRQ